MADQVSKLAAFVFEHGEMAGEILFRDVEQDGELPGVTAEEREAILRATPHLRETWVGILSATREALWNLAASHPCGPLMKTRRTQWAKMFAKRGFQVPLRPNGQATAGVALAAWGGPRHYLWAWCWTQARYRSKAEAAVEDLAAEKDGAGMQWLRIDAPRAGETYAAVGARTADALWSLARPIADSFRLKFKAIEPPPELFGDEENE